MEDKKVELPQDPVPFREISFLIPKELIKEFRDDIRVVIRHPWVVGIPIPERLKPDVLKGIRDFDVIVTPKYKNVGLPQDPVPFREISFQIPKEFIEEFREEARVVVRHPWVVGIPIPERLKPDVLKGIKDFEAIVTPRYLG